MMIFYLVLGVFLFQFLITVAMLAAYRNCAKVLVSGNKRPFSIIVPFRNEADRIGPLLQSLNTRSTAEIELIFVDDHSTDQTAQFIQKHLTGEYILLNLTEGKGKKAAIDLGVQNAKNDCILTLDADVSFEREYLDLVGKLNDADLIILPVITQNKGLISSLGSVEFVWLQLLTFFSFKLKQPFLCNGANLLFSKKSYLELKENRSDWNISSGDDVFLLDTMKKAGKKIQAYSSKSLAVMTSSPDSFLDLIQQRKRWISKMSLSSNILMILAGLTYLLTIIALIISISGLFYNNLYFIPIGIKLLNELLILGYLGSKRNIIQAPLIVLVHQIFYPLYLLILVLPIKTNGRWEN